MLCSPAWCVRGPSEPTRTEAITWIRSVRTRRSIQSDPQSTRDCWHRSTATCEYLDTLKVSVVHSLLIVSALFDPRLPSLCEAQKERKQFPQDSCQTFHNWNGFSARFLQFDMEHPCWVLERFLRHQVPLPVLFQCFSPVLEGSLISEEGFENKSLHRSPNTTC